TKRRRLPRARAVIPLREDDAPLIASRRTVSPSFERLLSWTTIPSKSVTSFSAIGRKERATVIDIRSWEPAPRRSPAEALRRSMPARLHVPERRAAPPARNGAAAAARARERTADSHQ